MTTAKYKNLFFDMCAHAFSQCDASQLDSHEKSIGPKYHRHSLPAIKSIQRLIFDAENYDENIIQNFDEIIKWMYNNEQDAVWAARMALKQKKEFQKVDRKNLEFNCPETPDRALPGLFF
ncbi:hypothetical protein H6G45_14165 [Synechocystis sp. FACHB-383]|uniref:hypothetical protein n=1 Tax=Synechocystis sp. FACHB-383 TaxID=2692864 RepID=UPI00168283B4|nr:hypothetical protein [Synechocystis sp. FACHB-383]MBD2654605.1 hypothetical protein [Synechocystis sp. FACHB-383]